MVATKIHEAEQGQEDGSNYLGAHVIRPKKELELWSQTQHSVCARWMEQLPLLIQFVRILVLNNKVEILSLLIIYLCEKN